ncbi:hypothetical protein [Flavobacterium sp.]|uniref:hypothetical protein n=1 Tax=Flavobacterium sp. TaxID=239 RepID=UPI0031DB93AE
MRRKYSKSGVRLPIINAVRENHDFGKYLNGRIIAGCEKVKGIKIEFLIKITSMIYELNINKKAEPKVLLFTFQNIYN